MWQLDNKEPIYVQIYEQIKKMILEKKYIENQKLPSKRVLADSLKVSPMTVDVAYQQLLTEGYIYSKPKSGYYVEVNLDFLPTLPKSSINSNSEAPTKVMRYAFKTNVVDTSLFPYSTWSKLTKTVLLDYQHALLNESNQKGLFELRLEVAKYLDIHRGMSVDPNQIIIGSGSTSMITLLVELLGRDKHYAIENPSYQKHYQLYKGQGVNLSWIDLDTAGMAINQLKAINPDIIHITPSHQFPTGTLMPISRRIELLNWANQQDNRYIIEDDYDSEFRYQGKPIPALSGLNQDKIIYMNTFTKTLAPNFRMNYMVLPKHLLNRYIKELSYHSCTVPLLEQYVLYLFMKQGSFDRHLNKMKQLYKQKVDMITKVFSMYPCIKIKHFDAGLHGILEIKTKKMPLLLKDLQVMDIDIKPMDDFYLDGKTGSKQLVLGYAGIPIKTLEKQTSILAEVIKKHCS